MPKILKLKGNKYYISKSPRKNKEYMVKLKSGERVHFADPYMKEYPGTKRGDNYCIRSHGIGKKYDILKDKTSPNYWSRILWSCDGKKSISKSKFYGRLK